MIDTIIFDMDGVICDTNPYHAKAFLAFFAKRNILLPKEAMGKHLYGRHNSYIFSHFLERTVEGEELIAFEEEKESLFREIYATEAEPISGLLSFLDYLKERDFKLGLATSASQPNMDMIVDGLEIRDYFGSLLNESDVAKHKPDPEVFLKSANNLGSKHTDCLVFEDSYSGISAAINAKMSVVGVLSSHSEYELPPCDRYIDRYDDELIDWLEGELNTTS